VPYNQYQLRSVGRYLKTDTVAESLDGLTQLARRYVLAKWLRGNEVKIDAKVSEAAVYVFNQ